jgi:hypothetical protein
VRWGPAPWPWSLNYGSTTISTNKSRRGRKSSSHPSSGLCSKRKRREDKKRKEWKRKKGGDDEKEAIGEPVDEVAYFTGTICTPGPLCEYDGHFHYPPARPPNKAGARRVKEKNRKKKKDKKGPRMLFCRKIVADHPECAQHAHSPEQLKNPKYFIRKPNWRPGDIYSHEHYPELGREQLERLDEPWLVDADLMGLGEENLTDCCLQTDPAPAGDEVFTSIPHQTTPPAQGHFPTERLGPVRDILDVEEDLEQSVFANTVDRRQEIIQNPFSDFSPEWPLTTLYEEIVVPPSTPERGCNAQPPPPPPLPPLPPPPLPQWPDILGAPVASAPPVCPSSKHNHYQVPTS